MQLKLLEMNKACTAPPRTASTRAPHARRGVIVEKTAMQQGPWRILSSKFRIIFYFTFSSWGLQSLRRTIRVFSQFYFCNFYFHKEFSGY